MLAVVLLKLRISEWDMVASNYSFSCSVAIPFIRN